MFGDRKAIFDRVLDNSLGKVCLKLQDRHDIAEIGTDKDHLHFLINGLPIICSEKNHTDS